ncbi:MAG: hypothetical protein EXR80_00260 [Methylococcales bacterium]|nr:hypothetical protein [Methylococcales bacterium]
MTDITFTKIKPTHALEICQGLELDEPATALLQDNPTTAAYLHQLIALKLYPDAVRFLAYALPNREATWWACLCARNGLTDKTPANEIKAIELAEAWVYKPTEDNRKLTLPAADAATYKNPASWAAIAAFWSGDDISPVPEAVVPPDKKLYAKAVTGAVMLAATQGEANKVSDKYQLFLQQGINIASGGDGRAVQQSTP